MKGENNRFYGKKHSTTTKKIMSQKAKERGYSGNGFKDGHTPWNAGMSKESNTSIEKISASKWRTVVRLMLKPKLYHLNQTSYLNTPKTGYKRLR